MRRKNKCYYNKKINFVHVFCYGFMCVCKQVNYRKANYHTPGIS